MHDMNDQSAIIDKQFLSSNLIEEDPRRIEAEVEQEKKRLTRIRLHGKGLISQITLSLGNNLTLQRPVEIMVI